MEDHDVANSTWFLSIAFFVVSWWYMGRVSRHAAAKRSGAAAADTAGVEVSTPQLRAGNNAAPVVAASKRGPPDVVKKKNPLAATSTSYRCSPLKEVPSPVRSEPCEPFEPEPVSDPAKKKSMVAKVSALEETWKRSGPPLLDDGILKIWHRHEGGAVHSFKYEVLMEISPEPCVGLGMELDLMPTWHKFVPTATVLAADRPGIFGGLLAYAEVRRAS